MPREVRNMSIEEAHRQLEEQLEPSTDYPQPTDVNVGFAAAEQDAIAELERLERVGDREDGSRF